MEVDVMDHGETALSTVSRTTGVMALAFMSEQDFEARLVALKQGQDRVRRIQRELMVRDEDFGVIPGTKKPTLMKPGAEKLCNVYGLVPTYEIECIAGDGVERPHLRVHMNCLLRRGSETGPVAGVGVGAANSWERKHRWRRGERACPSCGSEGTILRSKNADEDGDRGWFCWQKRGGCGANFASDATAITTQAVGDVENKDPYDVENTLFKMAKKRAYVDATLNATATSGMFTQDLDENPPPPAEGGLEEENSREAATEAPASGAPSPRPATPPPSRPTGGKATSSAAGDLPKWTGPCPRCKKTGAVMVSKQKPGTYHCWAKSTRVAGCSYDFTPADAAMHDSIDRHGSE